MKHLQIRPCPPGTLPDVNIIETPCYADARGYFMEVFKPSELQASGIDFNIRQENQSYSLSRHTVRGLHFQIPPHSQAKLVRVVRGAIFDVAVDIRVGSPTFGRWVAATLSEREPSQIFVPHGFAHGFCTLDPDSVVVYGVDCEYSAEHDKGVAWNDPDIGIVWPVQADDAILSEKDGRHPRLAELPEYFTYSA